MARKNPSRKMTSAVIWAVMFIFPVSVSSQSKPLKQIYVGVSSVSMGNIIIYVTKEAKLFEKYGLYADPVAMRGSGESSKAMIGGSIQVAPIATPTVINAGLSGSDLVILAHTLPGVVHAMIVKPEIKRVEDLKGKKVGVTTFGSLTDFLVRHILRKKGLNPDRDVALIQIGGDPERIAALKQGDHRCRVAFVSRLRHRHEDGISDAVGFGKGDRLSLDRDHDPARHHPEGP